MITANNYFEEIKKINVSKLPSALSEGHSLVLEVKDAVENPFDTGDKDIDETLDAYLNKLNDYLSSQNIEPIEKPKKKDIPVKTVKKSAPKADKPKPVEKKPKAIKKPKAKKVKTPKKPAAKTISVKKSKAKVRRVAAKAVKQARKADSLKPAQTVRKMSVELSILKQFTNLQGKTKPVKFVHSFHTRISNLLKKEMISNHVEMIRNIHSRLYKVIQLVENKPIQNVKFSIEKAFVEKCQKAVRGAKIRLRTDFLAGTENDSLYGLSKDEIEGLKYTQRKKA